MTIGLGPRGTGKLRLARHGVILHWCEACGKGHTIDIHAQNDDGRLLGWDGNFDAPTIAERVQQREGAALCEYDLRGGFIAYSSRCTHAMAGRVVPLTEFPLT